MTVRKAKPPRPRRSKFRIVRLCASTKAHSLHCSSSSPKVSDFSGIEINQFIDKLATFLNACGEKPIYILCNDINLSKSYNGGREFFDVLESKISNPKIVRRMHFNNNNKDRHFEYGDEYKRNCLIFDDIPDEIRKAYNPFDSCASAQILIKKEQKEVIR